MPSRGTRWRRAITGDDPVAHNLRVLTGDERPLLAPSPTELERELGLRFVLRARGRPSAARVRNAILADHGLVARVRPFPRPGAPWATGDARRFVVVLPGLARADVPENPFDLARRLEATAGLDVLLVEPDLPAALSTGNVSATTAAALEGIPLCNVDDEPELPPDWHLGALNVPAAWELPPTADGRRFGEGIVVGHPDTGWVEHDELDRAALDPDRGHDFVDEDRDARDPLERGLLDIGFLAQPGHGLGTGSVVVSGHPVGHLNGVAPRATIVPIRTTKRVWQVLSGNIARALDHAVAQGCHVVSISLGGFALFHLEEALNDAVARDVIVCAAAGNCIHVVPFPAAYRNCVAVAASDRADRPWRGSSRGPAVDVAAPGVNVWVARRKKGEANRARIGQSQGASPATAATAGVAALWLAFHGRDALLATYGGQVRLQHVFLHLLRHTARVPAGWDTEQDGAGIVDAAALLRAPLPSADEVAAVLPAAEPLAPTPPVDVIAAMTGLSPSEVRGRVAAALMPAPVAALGAAPHEAGMAADGQELASLLAQNRAAYLEFAGLRTLASASSAELGARRGTGPEVSELARWASAGMRARLLAQR